MYGGAVWHSEVYLHIVYMESGVEFSDTLPRGCEVFFNNGR